MTPNRTPTRASRLRLLRYLALADAQDEAGLRMGPAARFFSSIPESAATVSARDLCELWRPADPALPGHLYLHLPFCRTHCAFCVYPHRPCSGDTRPFTAGILEAMEFFSEALSHLRFSHLYLGGGTPTALPLYELERIASTLLARFRLGGSKSRGFYTVPATTDAPKARMLRSLGFERASLGVISLAPRVLSAMGCAHRSATRARRAAELLLELGFRLNVQLIAGLLGDDARSLRRSVREVLRWRPHEVTLYLPAAGTPPGTLSISPLEAAFDDSPTARSFADDAEESGYLLKAAPPAIKLVRRDARRAMQGFSPWPRRPAHLFSLGPGTQSRIAHRAHYRMDDGVLEPFDPDGPFGRMLPAEADEELRRLCATRLFEGARIDPRRQARQIGVACRSKITHDLQALCRLGLAERSGAQYRLRPSRPRLRFAAATFAVGDTKLRRVLGGILPRASQLGPAARLRRYRAFTRRLGAHVQRGPVQFFYVHEREKPLSLTPRLLAECWRGALAASPRAPMVNCYIHVPFCRRRCRYCTYHSRDGIGARHIEQYLERLETEMAFYAPVFRRLKLSNLYIGGGTPSFLSHAAMRRLLDGLFSRFAFRADCERCFECNPDTVTEAKIALLKEHGFNRVSLGVQSFHLAALRAVNRGYQTRAMVARAVASLRRAGLWVNLDLILGLPGEDATAFLASAREAFTLGPEEVTFTPLFSDTPDAVLREAGGFGRWTPALRATLARTCAAHGYRLRPAQFELKAVRHDASGLGWAVGRKPSYGLRTLDPASLLALGPSGRGYIFGHLWYKHHLWPDDKPFSPDDSSIEGRRTSLDQEMRCFAMSALTRQPPLDEQEFRSRFQTSPQEALGDDWDDLLRLQLITKTDGGWRLTVRSPRQEFAACMFLAGEAMVREAESWHRKSLQPAPEPSPDDDEGARLERERIEAQRRRLARLQERVVASLNKAGGLTRLGPGWRHRFSMESPFVVLELVPAGGKRSLRLGFAELDSQERYFVRTREFDVSILAEGGLDLSRDATARQVVGWLAACLGGAVPKFEE